MSREYYKIKAVDQYNNIEDFDFLNEKFNGRYENNEMQDYSEAYKSFYEQKKQLNSCNYKSISLIKIIVTTDEHTIDFENLERYHD